MSDVTNEPPEWFRAAVEKRIAEITGPVPDGGLSGDPVIIKLIRSFIAVFAAEAAVFPAKGDPLNMSEEDLAELFFSMSEEEQNALRRQMGGDGEEDQP